MDPSIIVEAVGESVAGAKRELEKLIERKCNELRQSLSLNNQQSSAEVDALAASSDAKIEAVKEDCLRSLEAKLAPMDARFQNLEASIHMQKQELQALIAKWKGVPATEEKGTGEEDVEKGSGVEEMDASRPLVPATSASLDGLSTPASPAAKAPSVPASAEASLNVSKDAEDMLGTEPLFTQAELSAQMASKIRAIETARKEEDRKRASTKSGEEEGKDESPTSPKRRSLPKSTSPHPSDTAQEHVVDPILPSYSRNNSDPLGLKEVVATEIVDTATDLTKPTIQQETKSPAEKTGNAVEESEKTGSEKTSTPQGPLLPLNTPAPTDPVLIAPKPGSWAQVVEEHGNKENTTTELEQAWTRVEKKAGKPFYLRAAEKVREMLVGLCPSKPVPEEEMSEMLIAVYPTKRAKLALATMSSAYGAEFQQVQRSLSYYTAADLHFSSPATRRIFNRSCHICRGHHNAMDCTRSYLSLILATVYAHGTNGNKGIQIRDFTRKFPTAEEMQLVNKGSLSAHQIKMVVGQLPGLLSPEGEKKALGQLREMESLPGTTTFDICSDQVRHMFIHKSCYVCGGIAHEPAFACGYTSSFERTAFFRRHLPKV